MKTSLILTLLLSFIVMIIIPSRIISLDEIPRPIKSQVNYQLIHSLNKDIEPVIREDSLPFSPEVVDVPDKDLSLEEWMMDIRQFDTKSNIEQDN